ncbi:MAG: PQQ-dependent sugar dehydrogenase [Microthrixaceae bacterium]|nr:PQQ-dependent sugar dehydrogenase [Microthrixaceae bacterium]MCO5320202.1 PQQ-dependent sugar dehydrogenase [Microthrixaceae bacterium]
MRPRLSLRPDRQRRFRLQLVCVLAALLLAVSACVPAAPTPTDVGVVGSIPGFDKPWDIAFAPDGTALITERGGTLAAVVGGSRRLVAAVPGVVAAGEGGLMGLEVDPGFATNRTIYMCLAHGTGSVVIDVRVVSAVVGAGYSGLTSLTPLLTGIDAGAGNRHLGCRLAIGPDAMLWVTTGDAARGSNPQDPDSLAGKVLRLTTGGDPAPGNPGGALDPYVYTLGHRNPQGLAFRPSDGAAFSVEHGPGCDDEINLLTAGANYGWAPTGGTGGYGEAVPMTFAGGVPSVWSSGCPTIAPSGAAFVSGPQWGQWDGQLVVAVLKGSQLRFVRLDGYAVAGTDVRITDRGRLRAVEMGPDGALWVAQDSTNGSILRIAPD